ncbi:MAG TPA: thiamine-phosphate kinase [Thermoanaerobaculia bacterium]|nr:thiamine-phosphate kinase [Thermoanaerobaculia bacterium]
MSGEDDLVARITRAFPRFRSGIGIGDDAAILDIDSTRRIVLTTDMLVEEIDFTRSIPVEHIARKSLTASLSDLAAMGAVPDVFLLSLAMPSSWLPLFDRFIEALARASRLASIALAGGDLSAADELVISITAVGHLVASQHPLLRSGARPGERIFLSRPIGGSAAGLALLRRGWTVDAGGNVEAPESLEVGYVHRDLARAAIIRHVAPEAELELGRRLAEITSIGAAIDLSDGLSTDLRRLCSASHCGAVVDWERIPPLPDLDRYGPALGIDVGNSVLHGGEDYALLFTAPFGEAELSSRLGRPVYAIGRITADPPILLERAGRTVELEPRGYDHFEARQGSGT